MFAALSRFLLQRSRFLVGRTTLDIEKGGHVLDVVCRLCLSWEHVNSGWTGMGLCLGMIMGSRKSIFYSAAHVHCMLYREPAAVMAVIDN